MSPLLGAMFDLPVSVQSSFITGFVLFLLILVNQLSLFLQRRDFKRLNHCHDGAVYPSFDPLFALDFGVTMKKVGSRGEFYSFFKDNFSRYGSSWSVKSLARNTLFTNDPENVKAILSTKAKDWHVAEARKDLEELAGKGLVNIDGDAWSHTRALLRPIFAKDSITDIDNLEKHMRMFMTHIKTDGSTIDLKPLFFKYTFDTSTDLLFGESTNCLAREMHPEQSRFAESCHTAMHEVFVVGTAGPAGRLFRTAAAREARKVCKEHVSNYVDAAVAQVEAEKAGHATSRKYNFLVELARETFDRLVLRDNALTMLMAGQDTTACGLSNLWFQLARHPKVYSRLVVEVASLEGQVPSYTWLKNNAYLRWCVYESMRTLPVTPFKPPRYSNKDTVLPRGGGKDGQSPLYVPKGTFLLEDLWHIATRQDIWGDDAEQFRPERWDGRSQSWDFTPFGGGPRICIGQQFALVEIYFVTVRLLQRFPRCDNMDPVQEFMPDITGPMSPKNGVKVALFER